MANEIKLMGAPKDATPEGIRRENDLLDQINRRLQAIEGRLDVLDAVKVYAVAAGRVETNGAGAFNFNQATGCVVTLSGSALRIRVNKARAGAEPFKYVLVGTYQTLAFRSPMISAYNGEYCEVTAKDAGGVVVNASTLSVNFAFLIFDWS